MSNNKYDKKALAFDFGRQMYLDQRKSSLVCFLNHLKQAETADYNELHGKYSLVQLLMEDFKNGKKDKAVFVNYNLSPENVRTIHHIVSAFYPVYPNAPYKTKFFKDYNGNFSELIIEKNPKMNNPWIMTVTNGKSDKNKKPVQTTGQVRQMYTDELFFSMWDTIYSLLLNWERYHYTLLHRQGEPLTTKALAEYYTNNEANKRSGNNQKNTQANRGNNRNGNANRQQTPPVIPPLPPIAPPPMPPEDDIPFNEMPSYGSQRGR